VDLINYNPWGEPHPANPLDYVFINPDLTDTDYFPCIIGYNYFDPIPSINQISAAPSCTPRNNIDADAVIRISIPENGDEVKITGSCGVYPNPTEDNVVFYIYKGEGQYNTPIWTGVNGESFDIIVPYSNGDQIFFATKAGNQCLGNDLAYWKDLILETKKAQIPTPEFPNILTPVTLIIGFLGAVLLIQRTREN
jgi:hypothetical protein